MRHVKRRAARGRARPAAFARGVAATAAAFALVACGPGARTGEAPASLTILYPGDERIAGPYWGMPAKFLIFEPLVVFDSAGEIVPRLAQRWEHSPDYREWKVWLRSDVRWHDGVAFTAHDVKFTLDLWAHEAVLQGRRDVAVEVLDDTTFTVRYGRAPGTPISTWSVFYPRHLLEGLDPAEYVAWEFWTRPIGNGPYRYVRHTARTFTELEANPDHFAGQPKIERVVLKYGNPSIIELLSGNADAVVYFDRVEVPKVVGDPRFAVYHHIWPDVSWVEGIHWGLDHPFIGDRRVRRALTHAIDRRELARIAHLPETLPIFDVAFTGALFRRGELPPPLSFDTALAVRLLDEAGWIDRDGDGMRERDGVPAAFTMLAPAGGSVEGVSLEGAAVYIQSALRRVGVAMDVRVLESNLVRQRLRGGDYDAVLYRFYNPPDGDLRRFARRDERVARLLDVAATAFDPAVRDDAYRELMPILRRELPVTFLFVTLNTIVAHRRLHGLNSPWASDPVMVMERLWIEEQD